jgi:hypothetical protein
MKYFSRREKDPEIAALKSIDGDTRTLEAIHLLGSVAIEPSTVQVILPESIIEKVMPIDFTTKKRLPLRHEHIGDIRSVQPLPSPSTDLFDQDSFKQQS